MRSVRHDLQALSLSYLEQAALDFERRSAALDRALEAITHDFAAAGTVLLRPRVDGMASWQSKYVGARDKDMRRWLSSRLETSPEDADVVFAEKPSCLAETKPVLFPLHPQAPPLRGLWIMWLHEDLDPSLAAEGMERFRQGLETLVEVEYEERLYFRDGSDPLDSGLAQALKNRDSQGLPALLALARRISDADFTYWGGVRDNLLEVDWHLGAKSTGFGFELPVAQGVGGRAFARTEALTISDYRNCQYRYPGVSDVADEEEVRSVLAVPVRSSTPDTGAVLFAVRRTVTPFSNAQCLLLRRLSSRIEPLPALWPAPRHLSISSADYLRVKRSELREALLHSNQVQDVESWLEQLIKGPAILVDREERPYVLSNTDRFERLQQSSEGEGASPRVIPLVETEANSERGYLYMWPSVGLPLTGWPDVLNDTAATLNIIIDRTEQAYDRLDHQRSQWLRGVTEGRTGPQSRREGNRLGLPIDRGEVWAFAWSQETIRDTERTRLKMLAENVVLDQLGSPLVVLEDGIGVSLLKGQVRREPSVVRNELLKHLALAPLWLVHGAAYDSFDGLRSALLQTIRMANSVRQEGDERYVSEVNRQGLDSLLENLKIEEQLTAFATDLLAPLSAYDKNTGSQLTETFCLTLTLGSFEEVANRFHVHTNTVRYRVRRAEQILGVNPDLPKDRTATNLAAFVWIRRHANSRHTRSADP